MDVSIQGVEVSAIASALPDMTVDLKELSVMYGVQEVERMMTMNGITSVRVASDDMCASDLCVTASEVLLKAGLPSADTIQGIVFVSQTADYILPATSASLQDRLKLPTDIVAFDLCNGCPGYIYGLYQAALLVSSGSCESVLVCAGDVITRYVNSVDHSAKMVFGDAGSATIVTKGEGTMSFNIITEGRGAKHLIIPAGGCRTPLDDETGMVSVQADGNMRSSEDLFLNGLEVMNFSVRSVPKVVAKLLSTHGWQKEDVSLYGFHQANKFMLENLTRIMRLDKASVPIAMQHTGNTGPASIPLMMSQTYPQLQAEQRLQHAVLCGFGVGLSCAAVALDLSKTQFFQPVELSS